ncbi:DUF6478 family protein [Pseudooceanicola sp. LIPI14-2-Ac024]|uniref:DUF6478 family protein n=1 Tax=Pseudooceanicola sp. LIPI14-2-Ac024 TaxID=3344875 RepID=UPI0035CF4A36
MGGSERFLDRSARLRDMRRWQMLAEAADTTDLSQLRRQRAEAHALRADLDRLIHVAEGRFAQPVVSGAAPEAPAGSDWSWRPAAWSGPLGEPGIAAAASRTGMGEGVTLFHDCAESEVTLRQRRNHRAAHRAPFGLDLDVLGFDGSFLSLVVDLPEAAVNGLRRRHLVRVDLLIEMERPLEIFARLNIKHGPNTEQLVREVPIDAADRSVEFDLAYSNVNEKRIEKLWLDLILDRPAMNRVLLRDLVLSRRPRAEL